MFGLSMLAVGAALLSAPNVVITNVAARARYAAGTAEAWSKANPTSGRVHPLKTLQGFDAKDFPWHVPY